MQPILKFWRKFVRIIWCFFIYTLRPRHLLIEPQEDIDDIKQQITKISGDTIALVVPRGALIFQSLICLKILRNHADSVKKKIILVTRDSQGRKFAEQMKIPNVASVDYLEKIPIFSEKKEEYNEDKKKQTFSTKTVYRRPFSKEKKEESKRDSDSFKKRKQQILESLSKPNKPILGLLLLLSVTLFFFVVTIAFPGASISVKPQKKVIETSTNVTLLTGQMENTTDSWRQQTIPAETIESMFDRTIPFNTVTYIFTGKNAEGRLLVRNTTNTVVSLKPSEFQTTSGIIFRSKDWINVPANGEAFVEVVADERDIHGKIIGERGNLENAQKLILPKLDELYQTKIWGEIVEPLSGGTTSSHPLVAETDIEIAKKQIQETILQEARKNLDAFIHRKNRLDRRDLHPLPGEEFLDAEVIIIEFPENILGKKVEYFDVRAKMKVRAITFSKGEMLSILRGALHKSVDPGMELSNIEDTISPEVIFISPTKDRIKVAVSVRGTESYVIEPKSVEGVQFVNQVKDQVIGKDIQEAEKIIENFQQVSDVEIEVWPPFIQSIPSLPENISVKLME